MMVDFWSKASRVLAATPLAHWPVRVRAGLATGARWTAFPCSSYWRKGGSEADVEIAVSYLGNLQGKVFWDFGAHFGIHTVGMAMQVGSGGQVAALEPNPHAFKRLSYHVRMNRLENVKMFEAAASSTTGTTHIFLPSDTASTTAHIHSKNDGYVQQADIATIAVDELVDAGVLRLPDLIKVDVEGHGAEAMAGCIRAIERSHPVIAFSRHEQFELEGVRDLLVPLGYRPYSLEKKSVTWSDFWQAILLSS
jgi:FkbM family methyltransferase